MEIFLFFFFLKWRNLPVLRISQLDSVSLILSKSMLAASLHSKEGHKYGVLCSTSDRRRGLRIYQSGVTCVLGFLCAPPSEPEKTESKERMCSSLEESTFWYSNQHQRMLGQLFLRT